MTNMIFTLILFQAIPLVRSDQKCYTNVSFNTGIADICQEPEPFCCYDISGDYYCCKEDPLLTILKNSSIVLGSLFIWTVMIVTFCFVFVDFGRDEGQHLVVVKDGKEQTTQKDDDSFSVMFNPQKPHKKDEKEAISDSKSPEQQNKKTEENSGEKSDTYKPAWGQYEDQQDKKSSQVKIGFKQKGPQSIQSVEALKEKVNKSKAAEEHKSSKTSQNKNFNQNVEKLTKTLNK